MNLKLGYLALAIFGISLGSHFASAAEPVPFTKTSFEQAKTGKKPVLLDFHADWCPTCVKQQAALKPLLKEEPFKDVVAFTVNFDEETELKKTYKVSNQSTLVLLKDGKEVARGVAVTDREALRTLLGKASAK